MGSAAFVAKLDNSGQTVALGGICSADGSGGDGATSVAVDDRYVFFGGSAGADLPTTAGAEQPNFGGGGRDGMVGACLKQTMAIAYLSYLGTDEFDFILDIALPVTRGAANSAASGTQGSSDIALQSTGADNDDYTADLKTIRFESAIKELSLIYAIIFSETTPGALSAERLTLLDSFDETYLNALWVDINCYFGGSTSKEDLPATSNALQTVKIRIFCRACRMCTRRAGS